MPSKLKYFSGSHNTIYRCRMDRLALRLVNLHQLTEEHVTWNERRERWSFTGEGWRLVVEEFEKELDCLRGTDRNSMRGLLYEHVEGVRLWAKEGIRMTYYTRPVPAWHKKQKKTGERSKAPRAGNDQPGEGEAS